MKREPIKTPCNCHQPQCDGQRLSQLHLYASSDDDVHFLEMLNGLLEFAEANPERVAAVRDNLNAARTIEAIARNN